MRRFGGTSQLVHDPQDQPEREKRGNEVAGSNGDARVAELTDVDGGSSMYGADYWTAHASLAEGSNRVGDPRGRVLEAQHPRAW